ncbi:MAG: S41 family peptidase [Vicingaceae bacterium]
MKQIKGFIIGLAIGISAILSYGFSDNYFELSKNLDIFSTLFKELNTYYVDETQPGDLMKTAIDEMLQSLDPYTNYIPESQIEDYKFMTTGQYGGIGALIHRDSNHIYISEPYEGFPAYNAGLKAGDKILKIDGKEVDGKNTSEISEVLKGQAGTSVKLLIERPANGEQLEVEVQRENIKIDDVPYYGMLNEEVGYIKLVSFTQTASSEFIKAFKDLKENQGMKKLIFDLRGNGGGLLIQAVEIVNTVIPKGNLVVETRGKRKEWDASYRTTKEPLDTEIPVVILVNGSSASASEIVAGTVQDYDRGVILGKQTYGKGLVQQTLPLSYNAQLKVTVAKYYIPSGRCIQKVDYSNKNNAGEAQVVPDSLIHSFKTLVNKREVFDGKGIKPDVITEQQKLSPLTATLMRNYHIFDFATQFRLKHESIAPAKEYQLDEQTYSAFMNFLKDKDYSYQTQSEKLLEKLEETAKKEKYYDGAEEEYEALAAKIQKDKDDDLIKFKDEVKEVLANEIVARYHYQDGRVAQSLSEDQDVKKALEILKNNQQYNDILAGTFAKEK